MGALKRIGLVVALAVAGGAAVVVGRLWRRGTVTPARRTGVSAGGMEYVVVGDGPRTVLIIPGGPGSMLPSGPMAMMMTGDWKQYLAAGYRVCFVTRPRNMPDRALDRRHGRRSRPVHPRGVGRDGSIWSWASPTAG